MFEHGEEVVGGAFADGGEFAEAIDELGNGEVFAFDVVQEGVVVEGGGGFAGGVFAFGFGLEIFGSWSIDLLPADAGIGVAEENRVGRVAVVVAGFGAFAALGEREFKKIFIVALENANGARPVGEIAGTEAFVAVVGTLPVAFAFRVFRWFAGVMEEHGDGAGAFQDGIEPVAEKSGANALFGDVVADVGKDGIDPEEVRFVFIDEAAEGLAEGEAGLAGDLANKNAVLHLADDFGEVGSGKVHALPDALELLGNVAEIVFGLHEQGAKGFLGPDAEGGSLQGPEDGELHGEGAFADAGRADDEAGTAAAEPAVTEHLVGIFGGNELEEILDLDFLAEVIDLLFEKPDGETFGADIEGEKFLAFIETNAIRETGKAARIAIFLVGLVLREMLVESANALVVFLAIAGVETNPGVERFAAGRNDGRRGDLGLEDEVPLFLLGDFVELKEAMAERGDIGVAGTAELEGIDGNENAVALGGAHKTVRIAVAGGEAGEPFLAGENDAGILGDFAAVVIGASDAEANAFAGLERGGEQSGGAVFQGRGKREGGMEIVSFGVVINSLGKHRRGI